MTNSHVIMVLVTFLIMKKQDICDNGKVNQYYELRAPYQNIQEE